MEGEGRGVLFSIRLFVLILGLLGSCSVISDEVVRMLNQFVFAATLW